MLLLKEKDGRIRCLKPTYELLNFFTLLISGFILKSKYFLICDESSMIIFFLKLFFIFLKKFILVLPSLSIMSKLDGFLIKYFASSKLFNFNLFFLILITL